MNQIAVLGSTGSIGTNCLEVIGSHRDRMQLVGITANSSWERLREQSEVFHPRWAVVGDASLREQIPPGGFPPGVDVLYGPQAIERIAADPGVDTVVSAIVGAAGLRGTWAALESGKRVAVANKETLVVAGPLVMQLAQRTGASVVPVDSEHSAIFQALQSGRRQDVRRVILTSSGGPFRGWTAAQLQSVTPKMALAHPTWNMGPKITVDSATMMNKALEVVEAKWLFQLEVEQIEVAIHPQSIVHSLVEFVDGSVIAQLSPPDMKLPIQYALTFPERYDCPSPKMDFGKPFRLEFSPPDLEAFPALALGFEVARRGGTCGAVLNAANEVAVERFLSESLQFADIPRACRAVLEAHTYDASPSLSELLQLDAWAREETRRWRS
jgi:1-deoxy-D-xylulose-5-phosphate reductoisomerase